MKVRRWPIKRFDDRGMIPPITEKASFAKTCDRIKAVIEDKRKKDCEFSFVRGQMSILWSLDKDECPPIGSTD